MNPHYFIRLIPVTEMGFRGGDFFVRGGGTLIRFLNVNRTQAAHRLRFFYPNFLTSRCPLTPFYDIMVEVLL